MDLKTIGLTALLALPFVALTVTAVVSAATREFNSQGIKVTWLLVAGVPFIGFIFYFLIGIRMGRKPQNEIPAEKSD